MVKTSDALLELPKRTAILVDARSDAARAKVRGLFWLTLATVLLGLVVVLASLWKTLSTPSVPTPTTPVVMTPPTPPSPASCDAPAPDDARVVPVPEDEVAAAKEPDAASAAPPGFPSLDQFP